ncbi:transcriptional regulator BetI [Methylobacterium nodulans]|uniref:HTH-type transcriptional regulator BetI n=1 Tax=Methylobacterium nodulans (strain LMG 21967 / CNCM I-2342 / ORS 2060) TaxID=460265 RepID=B8IVT8_METNO|nr:transcriptional regulator BetI [Methylobacterium nodulans]ACL62528.1 putative transcriptional regulator, TetR family [Methylobacterium nodulans ORS 2060]
MKHLEALQSFEAARRRHLIEATMETLAEVGFKAATLSEIARRANVSAGLFAHYFRGKDGLLEATLRFVAARLARVTAAKLAAASTRRERLFAVCDAALADEQFDRRTSAVWLAFWGQLTHSKRYQRVQYIYQRRMITNLRHSLRGLVPADCVALHARMIAAMIDGLWLRSHVANGTASGAEAGGAAARTIVRALIDGLLAGMPETAEPGASARPIAAALPVAEAPPIRHRSPTTGEEIARFAPARATEIRRAVQDAQRGLAAWKAIGAADRAQILRRCAGLLRAEGPDLARLESLETGRPLLHTAGLDLRDAGRALDHAAGIAERAAASWTDLGSGRFGHVRRGPVGIIAATGHWSAAILDLCRQAAGLAHGNAVVLAADAYATETSTRLADLFVRAGLPEGTLTVLRGDAESARLLRTYPGLATEAASAGGDDEVDLGAGLGRSKACTIVLPGADPARVAAAIFQGGRRWTGSSFAGQSRIYVHADMRPDLLDALRALASRLRLGSPLDPATQVGPLLSPTHAAGLEDALRSDLAAMAALVVGGQVSRGGTTRAAWLTPTVLDRCTELMSLVRGHNFAPVVTLIPFEDDQELIRRLVGRRATAGFGLFAGDPSRACRIANALDAAFCAINDDEAVSAAEDLEAAPAHPFGWSLSEHSSQDLSRTTRIIGGKGCGPI